MFEKNNDNAYSNLDNAENAGVMDDKLLLKLTSTQRQLLLDCQHFILDDDIVRSLSLALKKGNKYNIYLTHEDFDLLIGYVCGIANHEEDKKVAEKVIRDICYKNSKLYLMKEGVEFGKQIEFPDLRLI